MTRGLASIVIATRNRADLLPRAVGSLVGEKDVEIVIVDDASTDHTPDVCRQFGEAVVLRLAERRGLGGARNAGLAAARGEFVGFLDDDDVRFAGSVARQRERLRGDPMAVLTWGNVVLFDDDPRRPSGETWPWMVREGDIFWPLLATNFLPVCGILARREAVDAAGGFCATLPVIEDWDLWIRMAETGVVLVGDHPAAAYRRPRPGSAQLSSSMILMKRTSAEVQRRGLRLPRARRARGRLRRAVRASHTRLLWTELALSILREPMGFRERLERWTCALTICPQAAWEWRCAGPVWNAVFGVAPRDREGTIGGLLRRFEAVRSSVPDPLPGE